MGDLSEHFSRREFACQCNQCGFDTVDAQLLQVLEQIRTHFGKPVTVTSGVRCPSHNEAVGGVYNSQHISGRAADIVVEGFASHLVAKYAETIMDGGGGIGRYPNFTHIDTRTDGPVRWEG